MMAALAIVAVAGCSKDNEPNEDSIPEYKGPSFIKDGKIYIRLYAPKGMKYAPVSKEDLPEIIVTEYDEKLLEWTIFFEGEYMGQKAYWWHYNGSSQLTPHLFWSSGEYRNDNGQSYRAIDYTTLTCIFVGMDYTLRPH